MSVVMRRRGWLLGPAMACSILVACGDDDGDEGTNADGDAGQPDGSMTLLDAGLDANVASDAALLEKVIAAQISATGNDRFYGVTHDGAGNIYAVGQTSSSTVSGADYSFVVAKYSKDGVLDTSFGSNGYAIKNVVEGGGSVENARGIVVQSSGKIVIAGNAEHAVYAADAGVGPLANDADIYLVRFNANGSVDSSFGSAGVVKHDLGTGVVTRATQADGGLANPSLSGADSMWSLTQTPDGKLVIHTNTIAQGTTLDGGLRTDSDYALLRLNAEGQLDTSFGGTGVVRTDFSQTNAGARAATVLANGSIVAAGYTTSSVLVTAPATSQQPVLYKVNVDGTPDATFGTLDPVPTPGLFHDICRADGKNAEAYGAAQQGTKFVTLGYGPTPGSGTGSDWVWFRFNGDGTQDKTFGTSGVTFMDPGGYGDNGRALITLPDNKVLGVGGGRPAPATPPPMGTNPPSDGMIGVLAENGQPDPSFGKNGVRLFDFGAGTTDFLWSAELSPDKKTVAVVGLGNKASDNDDEDGIVLILPVP
ncbi:MAG TPA: hypothetical protein VI299_16965 [Polyangiales bacterium]